jgi:hypothetical protein
MQTFPNDCVRAQQFVDPYQRVGSYRGEMERKNGFYSVFLEKRYGYRKKCLYLQAKSAMIADAHV